jgi:hypothetical protein
MNDSESLSSDNSNNENFPNDFIENIPDDSENEKEKEEEDDDLSYEMNISSLTLEVGLSFLTWKAAFTHIRLWVHKQGFFIRKGRSEKIESKRRKQTIVCRCEGVYNNQSRKSSKSHRTGCKWHVNLSRLIKNNPNGIKNENDGYFFHRNQSEGIFNTAHVLYCISNFMEQKKELDCSLDSIDIFKILLNFPSDS